MTALHGSSWVSTSVPALSGVTAGDAVQALRYALHMQHGKPQICVKAEHVQQLLDTLKAFQALLGCQVAYLSCSNFLLRHQTLCTEPGPFNHLELTVGVLHARELLLASW